MTKCHDASCNISKTEALVDCSSPFCHRQFHLSCANLKGKKKGELNNIYFLCNVCLEFVRFSNSNVENKLNSLEEKLGQLISSVNINLQNIEKELKQSIKNLSDRVNTIETFQTNQKLSNTNLNNKIDALQQTIFAEVNKLKTSISKIDEKKLNILENELNQKCKIINEKIYSLNHQSDSRVTEISSLNSRMCALETKITGEIKVINENASNFKTFEDKNDFKLEELNEKINKFLGEIKNNPPPSDNQQPYKGKNHSSSNISDEKVKYRFRISCLSEVPNGTSFSKRQSLEMGKIKDILSHMGLPSINIADFFRLGKHSTELTRPRTLLVTLCSVWDRNLIFQSAHKLKNFKDKIYLSPDLTQSERKTETMILKKRRDLINSGTDRKYLKIKNNKLFNGGEEVKCSEN